MPMDLGEFTKLVSTSCFLSKLPPLRVVVSKFLGPTRGRIFCVSAAGRSRDGGGARCSCVYSSCRACLSFRKSGEMAMVSVPPARASSAWWLEAVILLVAAAWCQLLPGGLSSTHPSICVRYTLYSRSQRLLSSLCAAMEVDNELKMEGDVHSVDGFRVQQQWWSFWRSYDTCWLPIFAFAPLHLLTEGQPSLSSF